MSEHHDRHSRQRFKPYPAYKASGVEWLGQIPMHWEVKRLGQVSSRVTDGAHISPDTSSPDFAFVSTVDIRGGAIDFDGCLRTSALSYAYMTRTGCVPKRGDVLFSKDGTVGTTAIVESDREFAVASSLVIISPNPSQIDPKWLDYWLSGAFVRDGLDLLLSGAALRRISVAKVNHLPVLLPVEKGEQRAIAAFLDRETARIDALVAKKERLIELLQEKRTALITHAVTRGLPAEAAAKAGLDPNVRLVDTGSVAFPRLPERWELRKLRRVLTRVRRPVVVHPETEYREIGIRSWGKGLFHKDPVRGALLEDKSIFSIEPDDFVLNIVFAWEGAVGVATASERGMVASHRFPTFRCASDIELDYLLMVLQTDQGRAVMEVNSPGAAGRNRTIRLAQFLDEEIPIAPLPEQRVILAHVRTDEKRIEALRAKVNEAIARLKELRTALISAAVTGKIDVREEAPV